MASKTSADVLIGDKVYTLCGYESEAYIQQVASYVNNKIKEFDEMESVRHLPTDMRTTLIKLNIADDFFKAKNMTETLEQDLEARNTENYDLKHDLVSIQIKLESLENAKKELERENKELTLNKERLEAALENALFGNNKNKSKK